MEELKRKECQQKLFQKFRVTILNNLRDINLSSNTIDELMMEIDTLNIITKEISTHDEYTFSHITIPLFMSENDVHNFINLVYAKIDEEITNNDENDNAKGLIKTMIDSHLTMVNFLIMDQIFPKSKFLCQYLCMYIRFFYYIEEIDSFSYNTLNNNRFVYVSKFFCMEFIKMGEFEKTCKSIKDAYQKSGEEISEFTLNYLEMASVYREELIPETALMISRVVVTFTNWINGHGTMDDTIRIKVNNIIKDNIIDVITPPYNKLTRELYDKIFNELNPILTVVIFGDEYKKFITIINSLLNYVDTTTKESISSQIDLLTIYITEKKKFLNNIITICRSTELASYNVQKFLILASNVLDGKLIEFLGSTETTIEDIDKDLRKIIVTDVTNKTDTIQLLELIIEMFITSIKYEYLKISSIS